MTEHDTSPTGYQPDVIDAFSPADDIVEVMRANSFVEAQAIALELRGAGLAAAVYGDATAGLLGTLDHMEGTRIMVRRADLDEAMLITQRAVDREHQPVSAADNAELSRLAEVSAEPEDWTDPETGAAV